IMATLKAAREARDTAISEKGAGPVTQAAGTGRIVVLFQPHRYTRTRDLLGEFIDAFTDADKVILMDIYPAGEKPLPGVNSELLYRGIKDTGKEIEYVQDRDAVIGHLDAELKQGDMLITLGAGDVWKIGEEFLKIKNEK
ncbi:MAG: hypothetical protein AB1499_18210, partial [Nitrospirota bacterium]